VAKKQSFDAMLVGKDVIAQFFGVTGRRVEQLCADGVIDRIKERNGEVRFELIPTVQKYLKYLSDKAYGRERSDREAELKEKKMNAEIALKESQGELHRLRTEIAQGNYISVEEAKADYSRFFVVFKNFALALPDKLAGRLSGFVDPVEVRHIENELQEEVNKQLSGFVSRAITEEHKVEDPTKPKKIGRPRKNGPLK
jgi:phage terminase Nu1 subunit (DNA packaging protein)